MMPLCNHNRRALSGQQAGQKPGRGTRDMGMVLAGGIVGFWAALAGLLLFGLSPLAALAIWAGSGPVAAAVVIVVALVRRPGAEGDDGEAARRDDRDFVHAT